MPSVPVPPTGRCGNDQSETRSTRQTRIPFIDLQAQRFRIAAEIDAAIRAVLDHGQYIMGPEAAALETALAAIAGARHEIACATCPRPEEPRVGHDGVSTCRSRCPPAP